MKFTLSWLKDHLETDASLDEIVELAERWAKRHKARDAAMKDLELHHLGPKVAKAELLYEGILIDGLSQLDVGYGVAWRVIDKASGNPLGLFRWGKGERRQGYHFEPARGK